MFRRTRSHPDVWEEPQPPARAAALAIAGVAGTISLVVGGLLWAGDVSSQSRTFDAGGAAAVPAVRLGTIVPVETPPTTAPLSPVPLPPPPTAAPLTTATTVTATVTYAPQTAAPATVATTVAPTTTTMTPTTTLAPTTSTSTTTSTTSTSTSTTTTTTSTSSTTTSSTTVPPSTAPATTTLWDVLRSDPALRRFADLVDQSGLVASLQVDQRHTVLAPDDATIAAYADTPDGAAEFASPQSIRAFVLRHLILDELAAAAILASDRVETAAGTWLPVDPDARTIGGATLAEVDLPADNGVLHVVTGQPVSDRG